MKRKASAKAQPKVKAPSLYPWRFRTLVFFIGIAFAGLILRLAWIQVIDPDRLRQEGDMRSLRTTATQAVRGMITDRNGEQLAVSVPVEAVWADPKTVHESGAIHNERAWLALSAVLKLDINTLKHRISNPSKRFVYLQRQVTPAVAEYIKGLKLGGIYLRPEARRFYPTGEISAHLVGVTNIDGSGIDGIERSYNEWLTATPGEMRVRKDRQGRVIENIGIVKEGKKANDLVLSIDQRLQSLAYRSLKYATEVNKATSGSLVLLDVTTGEVLAMVNTPSYNPNNRGQYQGFRARNRTVTDTYEPGSTVKPLVAVSALEHGITNWSEIFDTRPFNIGGKRVTDSHRMAQGGLGDILKYSSNIGMAHIALRMPPPDRAEVPPNSSVFSTTRVLRPCSCARMAPNMAPAPDPTTIRSYSCSAIPCLRQSFVLWMDCRKYTLAAASFVRALPQLGLNSIRQRVPGWECPAHASHKRAHRHRCCWRYGCDPGGCRGTRARWDWS